MFIFENMRAKGKEDYYFGRPVKYTAANASRAYALLQQFFRGKITRPEIIKAAKLLNLFG